MNKSRGACGPCRIAHTACDGQRPCRRCTTLGKDEDCVDIERKRPGRPKGGKSKTLENGLATISIKKARLDETSASGAAADSAPGTASASTAGDAPTASATAAKQEPATQQQSTQSAQPTAQPTLRPLRQTPRFPNLASAFTPLVKVPISLPPLPSSDALPVPKFPLPPFNSTFSSSIPASSSTSLSASASSSSAAAASQSSSPSVGSGAQSRTPLPAAAGRPFIPNFPPPLRVPLATSAGATPAESGKPALRAKDADVPIKPDPGKTANPYLESLLSFLVEEVKELKQTNTSMKDEFRRTVKKLKNDITQLQESQHRMDKERRELEDRLATLSSGTPYAQPAPKHQSSPKQPPAHSSPRSPCATSSPANASYTPSSSSSSSTTSTTSSSPPASSTPSALASIPPSLATSRAEILSSFPFLSSYNLASNDVPFVLTDLNKPFLAVRTMDATVGEESNPPMVIAANPPFCQLINYSLHELLGCPLSKIIVPDEKMKKQFLPILYNRRPNSLISDIVPLSPLCMPKDGKMIRLSTHVQLFFSDNGVMRWSVTVIDGIEEAPALAEAPMTWLPGLPKWWSAYSTSSPLPLATLRASFSPNARMSPAGQQQQQQQPGLVAATANGDALNKDLAAVRGASGVSATGKRKLGDRSYDLGELLSNFAAPIPSPPVGTGDFAWLLKDGVGGGLVYAGSGPRSDGQQPAQARESWLPDFGKKAPLSSSGGLESQRAMGALSSSSAATSAGGMLAPATTTRELQQGVPMLRSLKPW